MKKLPSLTVCFLFAFAANCFSQSGMMDRVNQYESRGQFKEAAAALTKVLQNTDLPPAERKTLEFELDRLERIKKDYPFTKDSLFAELKKSVKALTREEFDRWVAEGRFDSREIDGHRYFMTSSVSNLFFRYADLNSRRLP